MILSKSEPGFDNCNDIERPYNRKFQQFNFDQSNYYHIPSTLVGLYHIAIYYGSGSQDDDIYKNFIQPSIKDADYFQKKAEHNMHNLSRSLSSESSTWDNEFDKCIDKITNSNNAPGLLKYQIYNNRNILKKVMFKEMDLIDRGEEKISLYRFSTQGHHQDFQMSNQPDKFKFKESFKHSFGDSLLAGYIRDGYLYSNISEGLSNYSACVLSCYDIHQQGLKAKKSGKIGEQSIQDLPAHYKKYIESIAEHELYRVDIDYDNAKQLIDEGKLYIPETSESYATCFGHGEDFHPKLELSLELLSRVEVVSLYQGNVFDSDIVI